MNYELTRKVVAYASAGTYDPALLLRNGYEITVNVGSKNKRILTIDNREITPDVIVWKPTGLRSVGSGKAISVELIETDQNNLRIDDWISLSKSQARFNLLIPSDPEFRVRTLGTITGASIKNIIVQTYIYDNVSHTYIFETIHNTYGTR